MAPRWGDIEAATARDGSEGPARVFQIPVGAPGLVLLSPMTGQG